jgi:hypothetical protein
VYSCDPQELLAAKEAKERSQLEQDAKKEVARWEAARAEREKTEKLLVCLQDMSKMRSTWSGTRMVCQ